MTDGPTKLLLLTFCAAVFTVPLCRAQAPPPPCTVLLTFDDGPDVMNTAKVLDVLAAKKFAAVFFVQTHFLMSDDPKNHPATKLVVDKVAPNHVIGIHTGSNADHVEHWKRVDEAAYDVDGDGKMDGQNALESDLMRAKARLKKLTEAEPKYVRAVKGEFGTDKQKKAILETYARQALKHIRWDRDSRDSQSYSPAKVKAFLNDGKDPLTGVQKEPIEFDKAGPVVVLFHDRQGTGTTADNIGDYVEQMKSTCKNYQRTASFAASKVDAETILANWKP